MLAADRPYPVTVTVVRRARYSRLMPLVKWLLLAPHYFLLTPLYVLAGIGATASFFTVIVLGREPHWAWNLGLGVRRWELRVAAYGLLMSESYPPFSLRERPGDEARLTVEFPAGPVARWRPLVQWLLITPFMLIAIGLRVGSVVAAWAAFFALLATGRYPARLYNFNLNSLRWRGRAGLYASCMVTRYPPFAWDRECPDE